MATSRRKPAIPPLRLGDLRELQAVISNIRERIEQLDQAFATASTTSSSSSSTTATSASSAESADTADALTTARQFDLAGVVTDGPHSFDGTGNVTIEVLEVPLALLEQDSAVVGQVLAWDGSGGWTPATLIDPMSPIDHGALLGLGDDDHPHYLNEARANDLYAVLGHTHDLGDITGLTGLMANVLQDDGDMIFGQSAGSPARLPIGTEGQILRAVGGLPTWDDETAGGGSGMANPMADYGDMIVGQSAGSPARLAPGTEGQVLTMSAGLPTWEAPSGGGGGDGWTYIEVASDFSNSTTTTSVVSDLDWLPPAAGRYEFEWWLLLETANTGAQPRLTVYWPSDSGVYGACSISIENGGTAVLTANNGPGSSAAFTAVGTARIANNALLAYGRGMAIVTGTPGGSDMQLGLVSETAGQAVTVKAGSLFRWRDIS